MTENYIYLGDGAYVRNEGYRICIYTSNGIETTNEIYLEIYEVSLLFAYLKDLIEKTNE